MGLVAELVKSIYPCTQGLRFNFTLPNIAFIKIKNKKNRSNLFRGQLRLFTQHNFMNQNCENNGIKNGISVNTQIN